MTGPCDILGRPWPPLALHPCRDNKASSLFIGGSSFCPASFSRTLEIDGPFEGQMAAMRSATLLAIPNIANTILECHSPIYIMKINHVVLKAQKQVGKNEAFQVLMKNDFSLPLRSWFLMMIRLK
jgi:hypothetical protein